MTTEHRPGMLTRTEMLAVTALVLIIVLLMLLAQGAVIRGAGTRTSAEDLKRGASAGVEFRVSPAVRPASQQPTRSKPAELEPN